MSEDKIINKSKQSYEYKLSAIVLVYNGEIYLRQCLDSLVNQTLDGLEIILINDASTDDSLSICKEYERDYNNVRIIDKKQNEGLSTSANIGIKSAKGEYIILVDNDDIVPNYAYEKLYNKAKETDADICVGKANFLKGNLQYDIHDYESNVWTSEKTFNPENYPKIFEETFYWNKIMRKSLLTENNINFPPEIKVYADRKFSHTAHIHSKKTTIIPECVYIWRIVKKANRKLSLSNRRKEAWNYIDRIESFKLELDMLKKFYPDYFKILMRRVTLPVEGILDSKEMEEIYWDVGYNFLVEECSEMDDVFDNDLKNIDNLYIYLTLHKHKRELKELLELDLKEEREIVNENGKSYWKLPLFRNPDIPIPDRLFEIKYMIISFLNINKLEINEEYIIFDKIEVPKYINFKNCCIEFIGRTRHYEILEENRLKFKAEKISDDKKQTYTLKIPIEELKGFEIYDLYFKSEYGEESFNRFRINELCIDKIVNNSERVLSHITKSKNLSICSQKFEDSFKISINGEGLRIVKNNPKDLKNTLKIFLRNTKTKEETFLSLNEEETEYFLAWKFFLDPNSEYNLKLKVYNEKGLMNKNINLNTDYLTNFKNKKITSNLNIPLELYKTINNNIKIRTR